MYGIINVVYYRLETNAYFSELNYLDVNLRIKLYPKLLEGRIQI